MLGGCAGSGGLSGGITTYLSFLGCSPVHRMVCLESAVDR